MSTRKSSSSLRVTASLSKKVLASLGFYFPRCKQVCLPWSQCTVVAPRSGRVASGPGSPYDGVHSRRSSSVSPLYIERDKTTSLSSREAIESKSTTLPRHSYLPVYAPACIVPRFAYLMGGASHPPIVAIGVT